MGKNKITYQSTHNAPENLHDHQFYGLTLDPEQEVFRDAIWDKDTIAIICEAKSGSGKTTISLGVANLLVQYGLYDGIVYIVAPTQEQRQGFIPGGVEEKNAPYIQPLLDAMAVLGIPEYAIKSSDNLQSMKSGDAYIEFITDTYLRGCNIDHKIVIIEECQNYYFDELKKTLTRIHDTSKCIMIGQLTQCDIIKHREREGWSSYIKAFSDIIEDKRVAICELKTNHRGWFSNFCDEVEYMK